MKQSFKKFYRQAVRADFRYTERVAQLGSVSSVTSLKIFWSHNKFLRILDRLFMLFWFLVFGACVVMIPIAGAIMVDRGEWVVPLLTVPLWVVVAYLAGIYGGFLRATMRKPKNRSVR